MNIAKWPTMAKKKGHGRHSRTPHIAAKGLNAPAVSSQPLQPSIVIAEEAFNCGYDVYLSDPIDGDNRCREFQDHAHALAFGRILRLEYGYPIINRIGDRP